MRAALLLAVVGCAGPGSDAGETDGVDNGLTVRLVAEDVPDELLELRASIHQVVLEGRGPSGHASVSYDARAEVEVVGGEHEDVPVVLELEVGRWEDVTLSMVLGASDGAPALAAAAVMDGHRLELQVEPELVLEGQGAFELGAGVDPEARVVLDPESWFDELEDEELDEDDDVIHLDLAHNRDAYEGVVERIVSTTRVSFPGEEDERDDSR